MLRSIGAATLTLLVYLGLSLLGWGLGDARARVRGYFDVGPRVAYAVVIVAFSAAVAAQAYTSISGIQGRRGDASKRVARQTTVNVVLVAAMYAALLLLPYADRREIATLRISVAWRWAGVTSLTLGLSLVYWSGLALGEMYSKEVTIQEDHRLVTTGLYRHLRHPRYLGVLLMAVGYALLYRSWPGLVVSALVVPLLVVRIQDEERLLRREFGDAWEIYVARSWRLLPLIY